MRGRRLILLFVLAALATTLVTTLVFAGRRSLEPSRASLRRQIHQAQAHDFTYIRDPAQLSKFVRNGWLVRLPGNADYRLAGVSYPYTRPEVRLFVERLSRQYRNACGERLVITSATRPKSRQPPNASPRSVHPTGMALDLRRSSRRACRAWLERTLLYLEDRDVLEASKESSPPHYHLVVFPRPYRRYVDAVVASQKGRMHRVNRGDTLWDIARRYGTSVNKLSNANRLRGDTIRPGQVLRVPG